ncbi:MAG: DUF1854 domain-containing protein [Planctomycetaceae bacterium]
MTTSLPAQVQGCLNRHDPNHRPVLLSTESDLAFDGSPLRHWLIVTADHLLVVAENETAAKDESSDGKPRDGKASDGVRLLRVVSVSDLKAVRTWSGLGSGILQVRTDEGWLDLLRYSNVHSERFHKVSGKLDQLRSEGQLVVHDDERLDAYRCEKCGLRLSTQAEHCPRCIHRSQIFSRVYELLRPQLGWSILLCLLTVAGVMAELVPPRLQQYLVDNVLGEHAIDQPQSQFLRALLLVVLALAASRIVLSVVGVFKGRLATLIGSSLTHRLRGQLVQKLQKLAVAYYDRHQVGSLMSRVAYDSEVLHGLVHQMTGGFLLQILQLIGVGAMLIWLNPRLAFYTLIPVPLVFLGTWYFWNHVYPRYYRLWHASSRQISTLSGMLSGIRVVKAFAQENREFRQFETSSADLRDSKLWVENATSVYSAAMQLVFSLGGLIVWYVGGRDVIGRDMTLGSLIAFLAYLAMFYAPLATLSNFTTWLTSFLTGSKRVLELLDTPLAIAEPDQPTDWSTVRGSIRFENVTFGYDRHQPVLQNISFEVHPGEMVGIVGRSGSGKSTLVNLLGRFYDVQEGRVLLDGHDLRSLSQEAVRRHLGIVFQESFLFRGRIWDNLSYGQPDTGIEQGIAAAKAAGAHDFICRTTLGYETLLGEHGAGLSGGEKQRLSIARTLLYDPRILVLDEATSNIDAEAERSIQQALEVLVKGRTTIAIAHRLSTLRNANRIIVFDRGRLVEQGTHAELLEADGVYARLVRIQTQITKDPSVDRLVDHDGDQKDNRPSANHGTQQSEQKSPAPESTSEEQTQHSAPSPVLLKAAGEDTDSESPPKVRHAGTIDWLTPDNCRMTSGSLGELFVHRIDADTDLPTDSTTASNSQGFVVYTFPATRPDEFLSVRTWDENGDETEVGMIRSLTDWPEDVQALIRASLDRRYMLRKIQAIHRMKLAFGYLDCDVTTHRGREQFTMRWSQSHAIDFGDDGKLICDTEDNRYVVADIDALPERDRILFRQHIYW